MAANRSDALESMVAVTVPLQNTRILVPGRIAVFSSADCFVPAAESVWVCLKLKIVNLFKMGFPLVFLQTDRKSFTQHKSQPFVGLGDTNTSLMQMLCCIVKDALKREAPRRP